MALSIQDIKYIRSLDVKKYRDLHSEFVIEGEKSVMHLINNKTIKIKKILALKDWIEKNKYISNQNIIDISEKELERISFLKTPNQVMAICEIPTSQKVLPNLSNELVLMLDNINNPGNMGTIIRMADWFGIKKIICSEDCVDIYNPKTVQSTMGSISAIEFFNMDLKSVLEKHSSHITTYGAVLNGMNIYTETLTPNGIILIGNESQGISKELLPFIQKKISIPTFNQNPLSAAESLNAATATAIILSEFKRRK